DLSEKWSGASNLQSRTGRQSRHPFFPRRQLSCESPPAWRIIGRRVADRLENLAMTARLTPPDVLDWIDSVADQFEAASVGHSPPVVADFLGAETGDRRLWLVEELIRIDLEYRFKAGQRVQLENYLKEFPELECAPENMVELIAAEFSQCRQCGHPAAIEDYLQRFPRWRDQLARPLGHSP